MIAPCPLLTHNVTLPRLTNNFLFKDRCALPDQMSFVLTFARRAFVLAMRNRDRTNLDEIAILGLSVTPKDFPHNMLPGRRPKLRVASHPRSARRSCPGPARCFFGGAKNRYYTQLCCSARVRSWPLADALLGECSGRFRGQNGHARTRVVRQLLTRSSLNVRVAVQAPSVYFLETHSPTLRPSKSEERTGVEGMVGDREFARPWAGYCRGRIGSRR